MYSNTTLACVHRACYLGAAIHATAGAFLAIACADVPLENSTPFSRLSFSARAASSTCLIGEPVALYLCVANREQLAANAHERFGWFRAAGLEFNSGEPCYLRVVVTADGKTEPYRPYLCPYTITPPPPPARIAPGTTMRAKILLVGSGTVRFRIPANASIPAGSHVRIPYRSPLQSPGDFSISAEFRNVGSTEEVIETRRIPLTIKAPEGKDADAYKSLCDRGLLPYLGYLLFLRGCFQHDDVRRLAEFRHDYAQTRYAPYAAFGLGQMHFYRKEYAEAQHVLRNLVEQHPKSSVAEDALLLVGESHRRLNRPVEADKWFREVIRRYPETPAADDAESVRQELARLPEMFRRDDRRLDVEIKYSFPELTPMDEVLKVISQLGGVPLRLAPELRSMALKSGPQMRTQTLRAFMGAQHGRSTAWVPEPDGGYLLVPVTGLEKPNPKPAARKRSPGER